ncbi:glycosyltransferase family 2 protein [Candidatus Nitrosopelagicus sp.]|nr:glycosyltransferase family 2 protein [Candidatus Nitrosopelagicus sp.]
MQLPKVSIIIVNYNGKTLLEKCLESVFKIDYKNTEVIVVDNNSTDDTVEFVTNNYPSIILLKLNSNKGFAEPNNIAAKIATGKYLLFLNNDTIVTSNFISEMIPVIENDEQIAICQSLLLKPDKSIDSSGDFIDNLGVVYNSTKKINDIRKISSARGASMLIRKNIFDILEGFDEKFYVSFEDVDLGWRTWMIGYKVVLAPKSIVYHIGSQTIKSKKPEIAFHGFKNQLSMKLTNFEPSLAIRNTTLFFIQYGLRELKIWLDYKIKGRTTLTPTEYETKIAEKPSFKIILKSIMWVLSNPRYLRNKQRKIQFSRKISTDTLKKMNIISSKIQ